MEPTLDELFEYMKQELHVPKEKSIEINNCIHDHLIESPEGFLVCENCAYEIRGYKFDEYCLKKNRTRYEKKYEPYDAAKNFVKKLRNIQGYQNSNFPKDINLYELTNECETIWDVRKILKKNNLTKYYKLAPKLSKVKCILHEPLPQLICYIYSMFLNKYYFLKLNKKKVIPFSFVMHHILLIIHEIIPQHELNMTVKMFFPLFKVKKNNDMNLMIWKKVMDEIDLSSLNEHMRRLLLSQPQMQVISKYNTKGSSSTAAQKEEHRYQMINSTGGYALQEDTRLEVLKNPHPPKRLLNDTLDGEKPIMESTLEQVKPEIEIKHVLPTDSIKVAHIEDQKQKAHDRKIKATQVLNHVMSLLKK